MSEIGTLGILLLPWLVGLCFWWFFNWSES
jgi:hypothetical protein